MDPIENRKDTKICPRVELGAPAEQLGGRGLLHLLLRGGVPGDQQGLVPAQQHPLTRLGQEGFYHQPLF